MKPFFDCFNMLSPKRVIGLSVNPLAFSEIIKYVEVFRPDDPERFIDLVSTLDKLFMANEAKRQSSKASNSVAPKSK